MDDSVEISARSLGVSKLQCWAIVWRPLREDMFSHFDRTPTCGRRTDRQTDWQTRGHSIVSRAKNVKSNIYTNSTTTRRFIDIRKRVPHDTVQHSLSDSGLIKLDLLSVTEFYRAIRSFKLLISLLVSSFPPRVRDNVPLTTGTNVLTFLSCLHDNVLCSYEIAWSISLWPPTLVRGRE